MIARWFIYGTNRKYLRQLEFEVKCFKKVARDHIINMLQIINCILAASRLHHTEVHCWNQLGDRMKNVLSYTVVEPVANSTVNTVILRVLTVKPSREPQTDAIASTVEGPNISAREA